MNTRLVSRIFVLLFLLAAGMVWADEVEVISITNLGKEEFARKQAELNKMLSDGALNADDKASLEQLRLKSIEVAALNEECKSFDISSVPNERCKTFYRIDLPNFEEMFGRITGDLYLNRLGVVKGLKERKDQIKSCISTMSAFLNPASLPHNLVKPHTLKSGLEPVTEDTAEFYYSFEIAVNLDRLTKLRELANRWEGACGTILIHSGDANAFAPFFIKNLQAQMQNSGFTFDMGTNEIRVMPQGRFEYQYTLNGKPLLHGFVADLFANEARPYMTLRPNQLDMDLTAASPMVYKDMVRIPLSDSSGVKVSWAVKDPSQVEVPVEAASIAAAVPLEAPQVDKVDAVPAVIDAGVGPAPKPLSTARKWAIAFGVASLGGAVGGVYFNSQVANGQSDLTAADEAHNGSDVQTAISTIDDNASNRTVSYGVSVGTALLAAILWVVGG